MVGGGRGAGGIFCGGLGRGLVCVCEGSVSGRGRGLCGVGDLWLAVRPCPRYNRLQLLPLLLPQAVVVRIGLTSVHERVCILARRAQRVRVS